MGPVSLERVQGSSTTAAEVWVVAVPSARTGTESTATTQIRGSMTLKFLFGGWLGAFQDVRWKTLSDIVVIVFVEKLTGGCDFGIGQTGIVGTLTAAALDQSVLVVLAIATAHDAAVIIIFVEIFTASCVVIVSFKIKDSKESVVRLWLLFNLY